LHRAVGFAVVGLFTIGWVWGLVAWISRRGPGDLFWRWVAVAQVLLGLQAVFGIVLLLFGKRVVTGGPLSNVLHYVYGLLPLLLFVFAHVVARAGNASIIGFDERRRIAPWVPFAWASFICFGLTLRALMTGLGWAV
jgi:predicted permease